MNFEDELDIAVAEGLVGADEVGATRERARAQGTSPLGWLHAAGMRCIISGVTLPIDSAVSSGSSRLAFLPVGVS